MANLSIENLWHLHESKYHVFWCHSIRVSQKKLICYCKTIFWAKNSKKIKIFKPFGLDPPTLGHRTTSQFPLEQPRNQLFF